jgi:anti-sigma B factor antagonist
MEIKRTNNDGIEVIAITGSLDSITSPKLKAVLLDTLQSAEHVELDCALLEYLSSAGLRILLQAQKIAQSSKKTMILKNVLPQVMDVFNVTGLNNVFNIKIMEN